MIVALVLVAGCRPPTYADRFREAAILAVPALRNTEGGLRESEREDLVKAAALVAELNAEMPRNTSSHFLAGKIAAALGNSDTALREMRLSLDAAADLTEAQAVQFAATAAEARTVMSKIRFERGEFLQALAEMDLALALAPKNPDYLAHRAAIYVELRRMDDADRDLHAALKADPKHAAAGRLHRFLFPKHD